ncbi:protein modifying enzyme [Lithospermum erythrorhizon]|uniref:procollagen-proline 4-dioxygenase n=1 Tax=Lithospermum erythrorhizon TaxID=34254 RepID=A0AAV3P3N6_LITER
MTSQLISLILLLIITANYSWSLLAQSNQKELRPKEVNQDPIIQLGSHRQSSNVDPSKVRQLSWRPRVFLYEGFISEEECDSLISGDNELASLIDEKLSGWSFMPKENGRPLQVLRSQREDENVRYIYFSNMSSQHLNAPAVATIILYLSNVTQGGQIFFPKLENEGWPDCKKTHNILRPIKGNAILFFNLHLNATPDDVSLHTSCPIHEGEMWFASKQFLLQPVSTGNDVLQNNDDGCSDEDESCPRWAAIGECQRNPVFMIGSPDYYGTCRKSCNVC